VTTQRPLPRDVQLLDTTRGGTASQSFDELLKTATVAFNIHLYASVVKISHTT
jgi:hypothetical protein